MKKYLILLNIVILILIVNARELSAAYTELEAAEMYNNAGNLYQSEFYSDALYIYEELIKSGIENPDLYYNASNTAYRADMLGKAVLYIEKALKLNPSDSDALSNQRFLDSMKKDREPPQDNAVIAFLSHHYDVINVNSAAFWSGISFAFALLSAVGLLFLSGSLRQFLAVVSLGCVLIFLLSTVILVQKINRNDIVEAVIMVEEVNAYSGPDEDNTNIFIIHEGTKVVIERNQDSWNLIRLKSGAGGWIKSDAMEEI